MPFPDGTVINDGQIYRQSQHSITRLMLQNPGDLRTVTGNDGSQVYGPTFLIHSTGNASTSATVTIFNANAPKMIVLDVFCVNTAAGGAADTALVDNGTTAITDAMDCNKADKVVTRAGTIDDAVRVIAAGGSLRVVRASAAPADVYILAALAP